MNGNGKATAPAPSLAYYDFYKTNGTRSSDFEVMPGGPSLTRQEFADECDINSIMKRYDLPGTGPNFLPRDPRLEPLYYDFASAPSTLMEFMDLQRDAEVAFMTLPARVRREFDNDPVQFVEFASDSGNLEQMRSWGLAPPAKPLASPPVALKDPEGSESPAAALPSPGPS